MSLPYLLPRPRQSSKLEDLLADLLTNAIIYRAKLNKSGDSYYIYLPRRYNKQLERIHRERREVRVIIIPT